MEEKYEKEIDCHVRPMNLLNFFPRRTAARGGGVVAAGRLVGGTACYANV